MFIILPFMFPLFFNNYRTNPWILIDNYSWIEAMLLISENIIWLISMCCLFYLVSIYSEIANKNLLVKCLSSNSLSLLARLSFAIYLVQVPLTWFIVQQYRFPMINNDNSNVSSFLFHLICNCFLLLFLFKFSDTI